MGKEEIQEVRVSLESKVLQDPRVSLVLELKEQGDKRVHLAELVHREKLPRASS